MASWEKVGAVIWWQILNKGNASIMVFTNHAGYYLKCMLQIYGPFNCLKL